MNEKAVTIEGKTLEEAIEKGLQQLNADRENVDLEILEEGKTVFNMTVKKYKVKLTFKKEVIINAIDVENNENGHYEIKSSESGNLLFIYPSRGKGRTVSLDEIVFVLKQSNIDTYDIDQITQAIQKNEMTSIQIGKAENTQCDAEVRVEIFQNEMGAYITILPPRGGKMIDKEEIINILTQNGVVHGIDTIAIETALITSDFNVKIKIASGQEAKDGQNGTIKYNFNIKAKAKPEILPDGTVDFKELNIMQNVKKGDILAEKTNPTEGTEGITVKGQKIPSKPGKVVHFKKGRNVIESQDGLHLIADANGQVQLIDNKITVLQVYEVNGNVDNSTGNINFSGKVIVRGNVASGFKINCEGDVEVLGVVEGAHITATGNIILHKGIQGQQEGKLFSQQDIIARYMENCFAKAHGDIQADAIMHCRLESKGKIHVTGKKGLIVGGEIRANKEVTAKILGSPMATITKVEVGIDPEMKERLESLNEEFDTLNKNMESVQKAIDLLSKMAKVTPLALEKQDILIKSLNTKKYLEEKIQNVGSELMNIKNVLQSLSDGKINISSIMYPGVRVCIGSSFYYVRDQVQHSTLFKEDGEIKVGPYIG